MQSVAAGQTDVFGHVPPEVLAAYCRAHHIRRLALFGSALRGTMDEESDVDVLVEFEPGVPTGFFELIAAELALSEIIGRKVDMNTAGFLSEHFRSDVVTEALVLYEG